MKTKKFDRLVSRRDVLRYLALGGAGLVATACGAAATPQIIRETVEVEKVVEKTVEVEKVVTATPVAVQKFPGVTLEAIMRRSFIPEMNALQENQAQKWAEMTGATVETSFAREWREMIAAAVDSGSGGDIGELFQNTAHVYGEKLMDVSDLAEELGARYGGWYEVGKGAAMVNGVWRAIPRAYTAHLINYRVDIFEEAGIKEPPTTYDELLDAATKIYEAGLPPVGFTMSQAGPNDSASFAYSVLWSFGGMEVEEDGKTVAINTPETRAALKYVQELAKVSAPDITGYDEGSNNRNFLAGEISATQNAASIYWAAQRQAPDIAENMSHFRYPAGPAGRHQFVEMNLLSIFDFSPNKEAAKAFVAWLMEEPQLSPLAQVGLTFYTPLLNYYDDLPNMPWNIDPKLKLAKGLAKEGHLAGWPGPPSRQSGEAYSNQTLVNMFASVITGEATIEEAVKRAEQELKAVYEA
ncbi:MAG: extracellular solute-binding protein [Chloroflexi bacterium]|nr:MAG: extracellular solute-binding protein [Chloroflexota bacterium]